MELETALQAHRNDKIALYGLSPLTGTLLKRLDGFHVAGLLDGYQTSGEIYGKPIFSMQEALDSGVRLIVAAARPESCKVIAKRIGALCAEHGIALLDIHGNDLCASPKAEYSFAGVQGVSKETPFCCVYPVGAAAAQGVAGARGGGLGGEVYSVDYLA